MVLNDLIENIDLGHYIKTIYDVIDFNNKITDEEIIIFNNILINRVSLWLDYELVADESVCSAYLKKFIKKRIVDLVVSLRQFISTISNKNFSGTHLQSKFKPLDNENDINEAPIFDDKVQFKDFTNYLDKVAYLEKLQVLNDWSDWVSHIIYNY